MMPLLTTFAFTVLVLLIIGLAALILEVYYRHMPIYQEETLD